MKRVPAMLCVAILALLVTGCQVPENILAQRRAQEAAKQVQETKYWANRAVDSIQYMKDPRTSLCFAYRWGTNSHDGPSLALATVPCEAIPPELLVPTE